MGGKVIQPYWTSRCGRHVLYNADCLEVLPGLQGVDAVVTDPPFGLGDKWQGGGGQGKSSWAFDPREAQGWDTEAPDVVLSLPKLASEVIVWGGNYFALPPSRGWLVWDKKQPDTFTTGQCELAWTSLDRTIRAFRLAQCEQANEGPKFHPTQKPLSLMEWCLKWIVGQTILDPFTGSGTTGVACIRTGRKFIGVEISKEYCDIAVRRMERELSQPKLPGMEPERMVQRELLEAR